MFWVCYVFCLHRRIHFVRIPKCCHRHPNEKENVALDFSRENNHHHSNEMQKPNFIRIINEMKNFVKMENGVSAMLIASLCSRACTCSRRCQFFERNIKTHRKKRREEKEKREFSQNFLSVFRYFAYFISRRLLVFFVKVFFRR